jgi:hypothetical protein
MKSTQIKNKLKESNQSKYGVDYTLSLPAVIDSRKSTLLEKHGVDHYWKTQEGQIKRKKTMVENHGVDNPSLSEELQHKKIQTSLTNYGTHHPMQSPEVKKRSVDTFKKNLGVENPSQLSSVREKARSTSLLKYGVEYAMQHPTFQQKQINTVREKYNVDHVMHSEQVKTKCSETKKVNFYRMLADRTDNRVTPLFSELEYVGVAGSHRLQCNECMGEFVDNLDNGTIPRCTTCYPYTKSQFENEVYEFLAQEGNIPIIRNSRSIISPKELDIFIPSLSLAVECNGVYYHSEMAGGKDSKYHLWKLQQCQKQDIRLIQIYDQEWANKQPIVKSRLLQFLNKNSKIGARKCKIVKLDNLTKDKFLNSNHIQGTCVSSSNLGLTFNEELVAVMTFTKSRYNKKYKFELARYCSLINTSVVGGASKLLKAFEEEHNYPSLISYCDLRYGTGNMYRQLGFDFINQSSPNYWYWNSANKQLQSRVKYQKHKLTNFNNYDDKLTEWAIMKDAGFDRIWDCGSMVFVKNSQ